MRKLVGKRRFWSYKVWKLEGVSHEMLVLRLQHVSSRSLVFFLQSWLQYVVMSFCVAGVALRDILMCLQACRNSFLCGSHTILSRCVLYTPHPTLHTPHFTLYTLQFTLYNFPLYTLHFTLQTLHSTLSHFTLHTAAPVTVFARCHNFTQPWQCDSPKTPNTTRLKCCVRHAKWRWRSPKCCACHKKMQRVFWKRYKSIAPATHKTTFRHVTKHVWMSRSATPKRGYAAFESSKSDHFYRTHHRHGIWPSHGRPRTGCGTVAQRLANTASTPRPPEWKGNPCYAFGKRMKKLKKTLQPRQRSLRVCSPAK